MMANKISNSERIARNTMLLYIRMLFVMGVTLFTSRIILQALGVVDFGIYNVVGGLSGAFVFFSSALSSSTQRYLNVFLGRNEMDKVQKVFNLSLLIYSGIALIMVLTGLIIGNWLIVDKLVIPQEKLSDAIIVFYSMLFSLGLTLVFSVYESVLIARENMKLYAYLGMFDAMAKLLIAYCLFHAPSHRLILYALLMAGVQLSQKIILSIFCKRHYSECKFQFYWNKTMFKEMFTFTGWNIYGSGVWMINEQGINILLNMFFGPVVNAARGISVQINNAVNNFSANFFTAVRPQIVKSYAIGDYCYLKKLISTSSRFSAYLLWILCLPIILRTEYILSIWLGKVPDYTIVFVRWILIYSLANSLNNPLWTVILATGKLKKSVMIGSNLFLLAFPISFLFLKLGFSPEIVYLVLTILRILFLLVILTIISSVINLSISEYCNKVIYPICIITIISAILMCGLNTFFPENFISLVIISFISTFLSLLLIVSLGISKEEYKIIVNKVKKQING